MTQPVLTAAVRGNLNSLQSTSALMNRTQERLATGLKVNSALDNPTSFFAARDLNSRASDLSALQDGLGQDVSRVQAASDALESIDALLQTAKAKLIEADQITGTTAADDTARAAIGTAVNEIFGEARKLAADAGYAGVNLIGGDDLVSKFNEDGSNTLQTDGVDFTTATSGITADVTLTDNASVDAAITAIDTAVSSVRSQASTFATNLTIIETRADFTSNMIDTLEEGAGKLTLADTNEESANMLALQTRQQLGVTALSLSAQAEQSVLRLF